MFILSFSQNSPTERSYTQLRGKQRQQRRFFFFFSPYKWNAANSNAPTDCLRSVSTLAFRVMQQKSFRVNVNGSFVWTHLNCLWIVSLLPETTVSLSYLLRPHLVALPDWPALCVYICLSLLGLMVSELILCMYICIFVPFHSPLLAFILSVICLQDLLSTIWLYLRQWLTSRLAVSVACQSTLSLHESRANQCGPFCCCSCFPSPFTVNVLVLIQLHGESFKQ